MSKEQSTWEHGCLQLSIPHFSAFRLPLLFFASDTDMVLCCRGSIIPDMVITVTEDLPLRQDAEHHQFQGLMAALPIRRKVLDAAGSNPMQTFEPVASSVSSGAAGAV